MAGLATMGKVESGSQRCLEYRLPLSHADRPAVGLDANCVLLIYWLKVACGPGWASVFSERADWLVAARGLGRPRQKAWFLRAR